MKLSEMIYLNYPLRYDELFEFNDKKFNKEKISFLEKLGLLLVSFSLFIFMFNVYVYCYQSTEI